MEILHESFGDFPTLKRHFWLPWKPDFSQRFSHDFSTIAPTLGFHLQRKFPIFSKDFPSDQKAPAAESEANATAEAHRDLIPIHWLLPTIWRFPKMGVPQVTMG